MDFHSFDPFLTLPPTISYSFYIVITAYFSFFENYTVLFDHCMPLHKKKIEGTAHKALSDLA